MRMRRVPLALMLLILALAGCADTSTDQSQPAGPPPGFREKQPYAEGAAVGERYDYWLGHSENCGPAPALLDGVLWQVTNGTARRPAFTSPWQAGELTVESSDRATFVAAETTVELRRTAFTDYSDVPGGNCV